MKQYQSTALLLMTIFYSTLNAAVDMSSLTKIDKNSNPHCVDYYYSEDGLFCNTKKPSNTPLINPMLVTYEKQNIIFDKRLWQAAWGVQSDTITTVEYVPSGEDIDAWHELVTSQFFPGLQKMHTLKEFSDTIIDNLKKTGLNPVITIIESTPEFILLEFKISTPSNLAQDELEKISVGKDGFYVLHYVIRSDNMSDENRAVWIKNLRESHIK